MFVSISSIGVLRYTFGYPRLMGLLLYGRILVYIVIHNSSLPGWNRHCF